jgi:hypothetical protein
MDCLSRLKKALNIDLMSIRALGVDKSLDKSGFMATRYISDKDSYTGKVIIVSHGEDGYKYAAFNNCK